MLFTFLQEYFSIKVIQPIFNPFEVSKVVKSYFISPVGQSQIYIYKLRYLHKWSENNWPIHNHPQHARKLTLISVNMSNYFSTKCQAIYVFSKKSVCYICLLQEIREFRSKILFELSKHLRTLFKNSISQCPTLRSVIIMLIDMFAEAWI